jgi:hypothetical protein
MKVLWGTFILALTVFAILLWGSDQVTWEGERTIYAVTCEGGNWSGLTCAGHLAAGERYRFRASRSRNEVVYWIAGSKSPSGKYSDCQVKDRDNWTCNSQTGQPASIALGLSRGRPTSQAPGLVVPFHAVTKWKWLALVAGLSLSTDADFGSDSASPPPRK